MLDDIQSFIIDEDIIEPSIEDIIDEDIIELSIGGQLEEDIIIELSIIELPIIELDELWAKPGTTAAAKLPATRSAATTASSFFTIGLPEGLVLTTS